ncbi:MAG: lytic murein transglycosylase B, partial [Gammaproteobacteria bacterium]|nr:lytic murein transglycosylase B [Gammaproteobacteria bacterium]
MRTLLKLSLVFLIFSASPVIADLHQEKEVQAFITEMVTKHGFDKSQLDSIFSRASVAQSILDAISRPAEAMPWYKYRRIFLRNDRINLGRRFIDNHRALLEKAEAEYGVPAHIIAAIIGVETRYGGNKGSYKVLDSLVTLGFRYPKRASFFRSELEQFLLLTREQGLDPLTVTGSYAGAMGIPQFISSSYRHYAVDFDDDGQIDIWDNPADAIGSVANYFKMHGWKQGQDIAFKASVSGNAYEAILDSSLKPDRTLAEIFGLGIAIDKDLPGELNGKLLKYEQERGNDYWVGL